MTLSKIQLYNIDYLNYGFTFIEKNETQQPQIVVFHTVLSNNALRPKVKELKHYFPDINIENSTWALARNPFIVDFDKLPENL